MTEDGQQSGNRNTGSRAENRQFPIDNPPSPGAMAGHGRQSAVAQGYGVTRSAILPDPYQGILQKTFEQRIPFTAHWELTYRCNISCLHCYVTNRNPGDELTTREIEDILEQLAAMGSLFLTFTGGEVFCRSDLIPILKSARSKGFALRLFTNGTLMTPELADELAGLELLGVEISLYATDPAIHDKITTVRGSYAKTLAAIKLCREREINTVIKSPLLKYNVSEYQALRKFAEEIEARLTVDFVLVPADDGSRPMAQHGLSEDQLFDFILENARPRQEPPPQPDISAPLCGAGSNALCISPRGDVLPCLAVRTSIGNLRKHKLAELWQSSSLDKFRNARYCHLTECADCEFAAYCARCSGVALAECGSLTGRSDLACIVARATKRAIERLSGRWREHNDRKKEKEIYEAANYAPGEG